MPFVWLSLATLVILLATTTVNAESAKALSWSGYAKGEEIYNFHGGLRKGSIFNGVGQLKANYDCEAAKLWSGGQFSFGVLGITESHSPSLYSAEIQSASNLSANSELKISNFSYQHKLNKKLTVRAGIMDLNDYFDVTETAAGLLNDAFGISPILTVNSQVATYPYSGFGAMLDLATDLVEAQIGLFQGDPRHQTTLFKHGSLLIGELSKSINNYTVKGGAWSYQPSNKTIGNNNSGLYLIGEKTWESTYNKPMGIFVQFGAAPKNINSVPYNIGIGLKADALSIGITRVLVKGAKNETIYEVTYAFALGKNFTLNPDLQYINRPAGKYAKAVVGIIRLSYLV